MQPSPELHDLVFAFYRAANTGDTAFFDRAYSHRPGTLQIGTDVNEWWEGGDVIAKVWASQIEALGGSMPIYPVDVQAWQAGDVGWVASRGAIRLPDLPEVPIRFTGVFLREDGAWKMVQGHGSTGTPNEEAFGQDVPLE